MDRSLGMALNDEVIGVLVLSSKASKESFASSEPSTLERFRSHVVSALSKSCLLDLLQTHCQELEQISVTDQLTGLRNRRYLYQHIDEEIETLLGRRQDVASLAPGVDTESKQDYVFFVLDLDHFKSINDTYGHIAGDKVLAEIGRILRRIFRDSDYCIRWGGHEFLVIARYCMRQHATQLAEKI